MKFKRGSRLYFVICIFLVLGAFVVADISTPSKVSLNVLTILYDKFDSDTSDFNSFNESELRNLSNVILEIGDYGRIEFEENLDIVSMDGGDYLVDFDSDVNISENLIYVDYLNLPGINKSAVLTIRDLSFVDPVIYNKGVVCSSCDLISYSGGVLIFRTPSFEGPYYAREGVVPPFCGDGTCDSGENYDNCPQDCEEPYEPPSSGGGGGDSDPTTNETEPPEGVYDFWIYPSLVEMRLRKGAYFREEIRVENNGSATLDITIVAGELDKYIFPDVRTIKLEPGQYRDIGFDVYISDSVNADVYLGKIHFMSTYVQKNADVVLQVREREALFDIRTTVIKKYINPGGRVRANISLINMGDLTNFDVNLEYMVLDFDRNEYTRKMEQFAINRTHSGTYFLELPKNISLGNYIFYSTVSYKDINASSYDVFIVEIVSSFVWIVLIIAIFLLIIIIILWYRKRSEETKEKYNKVVDEIWKKKKKVKAPKDNEKAKISDEEDLELP